MCVLQGRKVGARSPFPLNSMFKDALKTYCTYVVPTAYCNVSDSTQNMIKRKQEDSDGIHKGSGNLTARELRLRQRRLEEVIDNGKKSVFRALKLGRGFERQKMGRRRKLAKEKHADGDLERLDVEIVALKVCLFDMKKDCQAHVIHRI